MVFFYHFEITLCSCSSEALSFEDVKMKAKNEILKD